MLPHLGSWHPGRTNALLLLLQVGLALQAASRGMDYILPRPPSPVPPVLTVVERALPLPVWGLGFLLAAGAVMVGLAGGWWVCMVAGHAAMAVSILLVPLGSAPLAVLSAVVFGLMMSGLPAVIAAHLSDWLTPREFAGAFGRCTLAFGGLSARRPPRAKRGSCGRATSGTGRRAAAHHRCWPA